MMKHLIRNIITAMAAAAFLLLTSCSDDGRDDILSIDTMENGFHEPGLWTFIRLEDVNGRNIMQPTADIMKEHWYTPFEQDSISWIGIECIRESDKAKMTLSTTAWYCPNIESDKEIMGEDPVLVLSWLDMDTLLGLNFIGQHEDAYTIRITSDSFFQKGYGEVKWYVKFRHDDRLYDFWQCDVDGKKTDFRYLGETGPTDAVFTRVTCSQNSGK